MKNNISRKTKRSYSIYDLYNPIVRDICDSDTDIEGTMNNDYSQLLDNYKLFQTNQSTLRCTYFLHHHITLGITAPEELETKFIAFLLTADNHHESSHGVYLDNG